MDDPKVFINLLTTVGGGGAITWVLWALLYKRLLLPREVEQKDARIVELIGDVEKAEKDRDEWKRLAIELLMTTKRAQSNTEKSTSLAEQVLQATKGGPS